MVPRWWLCVVVLVLALAPGGARAQLTDCGGATFTDVAHAVLPTFKCHELERRTRGGVEYRVVIDNWVSVADVAKPRALIGDVVEHTFATWLAVRPITTRGVTFVLLPEESTPPKLIEDGALGGAVRQLIGTAEQECLIVLNMARFRQLLVEYGTESNETDFFGLLVAHELAHCVQYWNHPGKWEPATADWWVEGVAELLAAVAYPGSVDIFHRRYPLFKKKMATVPLTQMTYETVIFFQWVWNHDHADIFTFMDEMPKCGSGQPCTGADEAAQRRGVLRFLGKAHGAPGSERMQVFAQDVVDNAIPNHHGAPAGKPEPATEQIVRDSAVVPMGGTPWTLQTRDLTVENGDYFALEYAMFPSARARDAAFPSPWDALPMTIAPGCERAARFKLAYIPLDETSAEKAHYKLDKTKGCEKVAVSGTRDACATGDWTVDRAQYRAMLGRMLQGSGTVDAVSGDLAFTFDGEGAARFAAADFTVKGAPSTEIESHVAIVANGVNQGRWSAENGRLVFEAPPGTLKVSVTVDVGGFSHSTENSYLFEPGVYAYSCADGALQLRYAGPQIMPPDMAPVWHLVRRTQ